MIHNDSEDAPIMKVVAYFTSYMIVFEYRYKRSSALRSTIFSVFDLFFLVGAISKSKAVAVIPLVTPWSVSSTKYLQNILLWI